MKQALESMGREFRSMRTGRANPGLIEHLQVDYHGVPTSLNQIAAITAPESQLLIVPGAGHNVHLEQPKHWLKDVGRFMSST